jgi:hypothetical protein
LSQVAKSPNRRNPSHPEMIFRVRIAGLNPQTSYYYRSPPVPRAQATEYPVQ